LILERSRGLERGFDPSPFHYGDTMNYSLAAQNLCDELYKTFTGKHGFSMVGDSYGWEPGYMIIDWRTNIGYEIETVDPDDLEVLGDRVQQIATKYGYRLIKLQGETGGYGNFYFKPLPVEENSLDSIF